MNSLGEGTATRGWGLEVAHSQRPVMDNDANNQSPSECPQPTLQNGLGGSFGGVLWTLIPARVPRRSSGERKMREFLGQLGDELSEPQWGGARLTRIWRRRTGQEKSLLGLGNAQ